MYLLIFSIDCIYWDEDFGEEYHDAEKEFVYGESIEECIQELLDYIEPYKDDWDGNTILQNEYFIQQSGTPEVDTEFLKVHKFFKIEEEVQFSIRDTKEYKEFVINKGKQEANYRKYKEKETLRLETEKDLAELKRLKEKYEN